jgi:hypothetical protein
MLRTECSLDDLSRFEGPPSQQWLVAQSPSARVPHVASKVWFAMWLRLIDRTYPIISGKLALVMGRYCRGGRCVPHGSAARSAQAFSRLWEPGGAPSHGPDISIQNGSQITSAACHARRKLTHHQLPSS